MRLGQRQHERAVRAVLFLDVIDRAVVDDRAFVDQDYAAAEPFDVGKVVRRQDDGRAAVLVDVADEFASK